MKRLAFQSKISNFILVTIFSLPLHLQELVEEYDAVILCTGATWPRDLPIPGRQLEGIHYAMSFLENWQKKMAGDSNVPAIPAKDKNVIVIGGGDTGCDCIATSLRQVCSHLAILCKYRSVLFLSTR